MKSLIIHGQQRDDLRDDQMDILTKHKVIKDCLDDLSICRWKIPEDFLQYSHFERVVYNLEWNSSPGYPYLFGNPNNKSFFQVDANGIPHPAAMQRVYAMVKYQIEKRRSDPIRTFIKPEPISEKKYNLNKYRIISSISVIDQIIDHMLFSELNQKLILNCHRTPVKTGWTPILGGWKEVPRRNMVSTDKSSWDWTVNMWLIEIEFEVRKQLCENLTQEWIDLAEFRYRHLYQTPMFITSGGLVLKQRKPGVMKSGCVNTIASNSIMQMILHYRVARELNLPKPTIWAMGDDVIQEDQPKEYFDLLSQYCILKEKTNAVEFAGYRYNGYNVEPLYFGKHAYMLLHQKDCYHEETANGYALLYHRSKRESLIRRILKEINKELVSREILDTLWDLE